MNSRHRLTAFFFSLHAALHAALLGALLVPMAAQVAPPATPNRAVIPGTNPAVIELSPFEVRADNDVGYQAANTTSGSRLNSRLRDTPAAVSAFTPEFLADIAATNLEEMLAHATNLEIDVEDANAGFNNPQGRGADGNDYQFRMRGSPAGASRDFVESSVPVDLYNVERAEMASGPNSILFGLGQAGGLVSLSGKKAHLQRARTTLKSLLGSWHFERYEADHNQVLVPKKIALRLLGLYQNNQGWRYWDFNDQARWTAALAYQPFKYTTVHASYEKGHMDNNLTLGWNGSDQISAWQEGGRPIIDGTAAPAGTSRFSATNQRFTFSQQSAGVNNLKGEFQSNRTDVEANGMAVGGGNLRADPNLTLPRPDGTAGTAPNPFAGQIYFESIWFKDRILTDNEIFRASAAWEGGSSTRWYGRHRVAGLVEQSRQDRLRRWRDEILVDDNNVPIANAAIAENAQNQLTRRNYARAGDYQTYYASDPSIPVPPFTLNGKIYHTTYASRVRANTHSLKDITSFMLASQSFWLQDRLVTTLGARRDEIIFRNAGEARILDPNDPRVRAQAVALGEWYFDGTTTRYSYRPTTFTAGGVLHATKRLSVFANLSRNNGQPRFDRTVLPKGDVPEPTEGRGRDFGFMLDVLGEDRLFVRTTWYQTEQLKDSPILPGSNALGVDNLSTMLGALLSAGKISPADYDRQAISWTSASIDILTKGLEIEVVANPTKNLTLRASYSHSERQRQNFFSEVFQFFDARIPNWRRLLANNPTELAAFETAARELYSELEYQVDRQNSPFGTRPHKANGTARYRFSEGLLRGVFIGSSLRYNGKNFLSWDKPTGYIYWGNESLLADAFAGYRGRLPFAKINGTVQINVKNLGNSYLANIGRYNDTYTGVRRIYFNEPRSYRLTTTFEF